MVIAAASEGLSGTSLFVLIVVLAGSVAAGLFFATPLSARLRGAGRRSRPSRPWSTAAPPPSLAQTTKHVATTEPWSASSVRDRLQDGR